MIPNRRSPREATCSTSAGWASDGIESLNFGVFLLTRQFVNAASALPFAFGHRKKMLPTLIAYSWNGSGWDFLTARHPAPFVRCHYGLRVACLRAEEIFFKLPPGVSSQPGQLKRLVTRTKPNMVVVLPGHFID